MPQRSWTPAEKRAIATYEPNTRIAEVAACFEVSPGQINYWRRKISEGRLERWPQRTTRGVARVELTGSGLAAAAIDPGSIRTDLPNGASLTVDGMAEQALIERVIAALRS